MLQLQEMRNKVSEMSGRDAEEVRVVVSPYRICPLGAHIDHQVSSICFDFVVLINDDHSGYIFYRKIKKLIFYIVFKKC